MNSSDCPPDRLLIVDDVPDNVFLARTILEEEGYEVLTAADGPTALHLVATEKPDLVLLDVMMPGMDGYEVTQRIRQMPDLPFIPILLITAYDRANAVQGLDLGADEFIRKPIEAEELLARVRSLLRLKHSIQERDRIAQQRQDFVSRLTHDLRTPLVAADRMLGLLQQGALGEINPSVCEALVIMERSNRNLLEMVNTLLDVYRYEAGSKTLALQPLDLHTLLPQVIEELESIATSKGLGLNLVLEPSAKLQDVITVQGDRLELIRVFNNLIGNSLKFTETGSVNVHVDLESSDTNGTAAQYAKVTIRDTGIGIPSAEIPLLFQRFRQGKHQKQGSGLGLYLSNYIVVAHGGSITVASQPEQGSEFTVRLPI